MFIKGSNKNRITWHRSVNSIMGIFHADTPRAVAENDRCFRLLALMIESSPKILFCFSIYLYFDLYYYRW